MPSESDFEHGLMTLGHFDQQLKALSDKRVLEILHEMDGKPFANSEVRSLLGVRRQATWTLLARLAQIGLIEKRGHLYRVSRFAHDFVNAASLTFKNLITGGEIRPPGPALSDALRLASQGVELLYSKGRIAEAEYFEFRKAVGEVSDR